MAPVILGYLATLIVVVLMVVWWMKIVRSHALHDAAAHGKTDRIESLIASGHGVDTLYGGESALHVAIKKHQVDAAKCLISQGGSVTLETQSENHETALHLAAMTGDCDIVTLLLDAGADINALTSSHEPPVLTAARHGHKDVLTLLIERGADCEIKDLEGNSLLFRCVLAAETDVVGMLLDAGVDPNCQDAKKQAYALHAAMVYAAHTDKHELVECLLKHGADPNVRDQHGMTPMKMANIAAKDSLSSLLGTYGAKA